MNKELLIINQHKSAKYTPRTAHNASSADLTLALAINLMTAGEIFTRKVAGDKYIGVELTQDIDDIQIARQLYKKLKELNAKKLNIAGNGIYTLAPNGCSQDFINYFTYKIIAKVNQYWPIEKIYTGGQTGVDLAGAVTGYLLNIPTEVTLPLGYIQRFEDKKDVEGTRDKVFDQIHNGALIVMEKLEEEKIVKVSQNKLKA